MTLSLYSQNLTGKTNSVGSFYRWLKSEPEHKWLLLYFWLLAIIQFLLFKYVYPYPNFIPADSLSYIEAAANRKHINLWPIGYSYFLRFIHFFDSSDFWLAFFQYIFLLITILYLVFTVSYFLKPGKWVIRTLLVIILVNPITCHISNFILSDALFTSLSIIWFTQLIWVLNYPNKVLLITHALVLLLAFMVRFNALYFPLISGLVILLSNAKRLDRNIGIFTIAILHAAFIVHTHYQYKQRTDRFMFSAFSGWQLASNALYSYAQTRPIPTEKVGYRFKELHSIVNIHIDSLRGLKRRPDKDLGTYFLWHNEAPLKRYMSQYFPKEHKFDHFTQWSVLSSLYYDYGWYLIKHRPGAYLHYFIWPNLKNNFMPPTGFMGIYNVGNKSVPPAIGQWFRWKKNSVFTRFGDTQIHIIQYFTFLFVIFNLLFILGLIAILWLKGPKKLLSLNNGILVLTLFVWFANVAFSTISSPIELRYQLFPFVIIQVLGVMELTLIAKTGQALTRETFQNPEPTDSHTNANQTDANDQ